MAFSGPKTKYLRAQSLQLQSVEIINSAQCQLAFLKFYIIKKFKINRFYFIKHKYASEEVFQFKGVFWESRCHLLLNVGFTDI